MRGRVLHSVSESNVTRRSDSGDGLDIAPDLARSSRYTMRANGKRLHFPKMSCFFIYSHCGSEECTHKYIMGIYMRTRGVGNSLLPPSHCGNFFYSRRSLLLDNLADCILDRLRGVEVDDLGPVR